MEFFIDESGNLGKKDRYFVIAMIFSYQKKRILNFMKSFLAKKEIFEIKASKLTFMEKQNLIIKLAKMRDNNIFYIVADKKHINKNLFKDKNLCFNYLFKFLVKNAIKKANENVNILVDEHTLKVGSINSLKDYIKIEALTEWGFEHQVNICFSDSRASKMIQAADLVANAIYAKYNYKKDHLYNMFKPNIAESIKFPYKKFGKK